ncbi:transmembrane protein, putative (macronuclear) [Tetrahymena thermophila SB210]|uniref:Transmembrane protein, putative n=1 Tax=Tetrahymena thermophila (strain SB210) TaxID=312017 RepID=Q22AD8_TETTS|nr:transmembrane protein, putative [Tetrahymena thermophila SB210]EAR82255.2 transmembrane protein, putative [Tetrahymena thermophila SB210]|eukprot:XP_001029918.2 transmembrane protein, putative [Tetrahymena thermophila SB210]
MDQNRNIQISDKSLQGNLPLILPGQPPTDNEKLNKFEDEIQVNQTQQPSKSNICSINALNQENNALPFFAENTQANQNIVTVKVNSSKKKWIIGLAILLAIGAILGVVLALTLKSNNQSDFQEVIKIPTTYAKYKSMVDEGQDNNLVKMMHVPKSQKIYEYKLYNNQTTMSGDGQKSVTNSLIVHQFGLICSDVTKDEFKMFIYIIDTKMYENDKLSSQLTGFTKIQEKEMAAGAKRNLQQAQQDVQDSMLEGDEFLNEESNKSLENEYAPLNEQEIKLLASKGISADQYYASRYPIIQFTLDKNSKVKQVQQPVNLRLDIFQVYLNIIEQVTPIVQSDLYKITDQNGNKRRMLLNYEQRILSGEKVQPQLQANMDKNGQANLNKQYEQNKVNDNNSTQKANYIQDSVIQNGALLESKAKSNFKIEDNKVEENEEMPLFKGIEMNSECKISFVSQEDEVDDNFINLITTTFEGMSILSQTYDEAIDTYNTIFNTSTQDGESQTDMDGEIMTGSRLLAQKNNNLSPPIQKPIFRKNVASFEFGADVRAECKDSGRMNKQDICSIGLYSFFNGASVKLVERQTKVNVSKILKLYQYIQHMVKDKLDIVKENVTGRLTRIKNSIDKLMDDFETVITVEKNPLLKVIYDGVNNDELQIFDLISKFEQVLQASVTTISKIIKDPLNNLKEKILGFLSRKNMIIESQMNYIQNILVDKLSETKKLIDSQTKGLPAGVEEQIKLVLETLEDLLEQIIYQPLSQHFDAVEDFALKQINVIFGSISEVDKYVSTQDVPKDAQETQKKLKQIIGSSQVIDTIKSIINKTVKTISEQHKVSDQMLKVIKQSVNDMKLEIYLKLKDLKTKYPESNSDSPSNEIQAFLSSFSEIYNFNFDLTTGIKEWKQDVQDIVKTIRKLQEKRILTLIKSLFKQVTQFPKNLVIQLVKQGKETVSKAKSAAIQMKEDIIKLKNNVFENSKNILDDLKGLFAELKAFVSKTPKPDDNDSKFYETPLFDEIKDIVESVQAIVSYNYGEIGQTFKRFSGIPSKFQKFVDDLKLLGKQCMNYFGQIKLSITGIYIDQKQAWNDIRAQFEQPKTEITQQIQDTFEDEYNKSLNKEVVSELSQDINGLQINQLETYKQDVQKQSFDVNKLFQNLIEKLITEANFEKIIEPFAQKIPFQYTYLYPTPIGLSLVLRLYASWDTSLQFKVSLKNAILDLGAGVSTKVTIGGEVGASAYVAEVGGYAEGTFLETSLMVGLDFKVLEKFKGSFYIDGSFKPYHIKIGIYYKTIFSLEKISCDLSRRRRNLKRSSSLKNFFKKAVNAVVKAAKVIAKAVQKVIKCISTIEIEQKRHDIINPIDIQGPTFSKRLVELKF